MPTAIYETDATTRTRFRPPSDPIEAPAVQQRFSTSTVTYRAFVTSFPTNIRVPMTREDDDAALIPDWAAIVAAVGAVVSAVAFVSAWLTDSGVALLALTAGLLFFAWGMAAAEKAIINRD